MNLGTRTSWEQLVQYAAERRIFNTHKKPPCSRHVEVALAYQHEKERLAKQHATPGTQLLGQLFCNNEDYQWTYNKYPVQLHPGIEQRLLWIHPRVLKPEQLHHYNLQTPLEVAEMYRYIRQIVYQYMHVHWSECLFYEDPINHRSVSEIRHFKCFFR